MSLQPQNSDIQDLLRKLRTGELTSHEWKTLEQAAKDDPFLAEALEGLRLLDQEKRSKHLQSLNTRLMSAVSVKKEQKRRIVLPRLVAAAAIVVLLIGSWIIWNLDPAPATEQTALITDDTSTPAEGPTSDPQDEPQSGTSASTAEIQPEAITPPPAETPAPPPDGAARQTDVPQSTFLIDGVPLNEGGAIANESAESDREVPAFDVVREEEEADNAQAPGYQAQIEANYADLHQVQLAGVVQDGTGEPLIGANIQLKGTALNAITDMSGNFMLEVPQTDELVARPTLVVSYVGYETLETPVEDNNNNVVLQLAESTLSMDEVTVTGLGTRAKKSAGRESAEKSRALAKPVGGERRYQRYIRQNMQMPAAAEQNRINGTVVVEFNILPDGRPGEIRVIDSLGHGCDEEAVRLVKNGPDWDVASAQVPIGRVTVSF